MLYKVFKKSRSVLFNFLCVLSIIVGLFYIQTTIFDFGSTINHSGNKVYNPYQNIEKSTIKANFHSHSQCWGGLTNGSNTLAHMQEAYANQAVDVAPVSNYFLPETLAHTSAYEHGLNINKDHLLVLNAKHTSFFDFPFWQNISQQQQIVDICAALGEAVVLAHPNLRYARSPEAMEKLVGYDFVEIKSYYSDASWLWQRALLHGRISWLMVNDDSHSTDKQPVGKFYNLVFEHDSKRVLTTMLQGKHIGLALENTHLDAPAPNINIKYDSLQNIINYNFGRNICSVKIITNKNETTTAHYKGQIPFGDNLQFVRFEIKAPNATIYTNPIFKYAGQKPKMASLSTATPNKPKTLAYRLFVFCIISCATGLLFRSKIRVIKWPKQKLRPA